MTFFYVGMAVAHEAECGKMEIEMGIEIGIGIKWTIEFNQKIMDKIGFSIRKSTLFNVLLIQRLKKKIKIALGVLVKKCVHLAPHRNS